MSNPSSYTSHVELLSRGAVADNTIFKFFLVAARDSSGRATFNSRSVDSRRATPVVTTDIANLPVRAGYLGSARAYRHPLACPSWEIPNGYIDADESPREAACPDPNNDTGVILSDVELCDLGAAADDADVTGARISLFANVLHMGATSAAESERGHGEVRWSAGADALRMIAAGDIEDASTLIGILPTYPGPHRHPGTVGGSDRR